MDNFAKKYRLWLVIPLFIAAVTALFSVKAAVALLSFTLFVWGFCSMIILILRITRKLSLIHI